MLPFLFLFVGIALIIVGGFMFLIAAFREGVLWGLACLCVPVVQVFFLIVHWQEARKAFVIQLIGIALLVLTAMGSPETIPPLH